MKDLIDKIKKIDDTVEPPFVAQEVFGMFETVTTVPTKTPKNLVNQIVFYTDSLSAPSVYRLYIYSTKLNVWKYVALS